MREEDRRESERRVQESIHKRYEDMKASGQQPEIEWWITPLLMAVVGIPTVLFLNWCMTILDGSSTPSEPMLRTFEERFESMQECINATTSRVGGIDFVTSDTPDLYAGVGQRGPGFGFECMRSGFEIRGRYYIPR